MKTEHLVRLSTDMAIEQLKKESMPKGKVSIANPCNEGAPEGITDDWGDSCKGYQCLKEKEHQGSHMASDGANGWVYWD